jgi:hypothetical protein
MSFPYGEILNESFQHLNRGLPFALVKKVTLAALRVPHWIVTEDLTKGDSGAPVAFYPTGSKTMCIAVVVSSIERYHEPVYRQAENGEYIETDLFVAERAGFGSIVPIERVFTRTSDA